MAMIGGIIGMVGGLVQAQGAMEQGKLQAQGAELQAVGAEFKAGSEVTAHEYNIAVDRRNRGVIADQTSAAIDIKNREGIRQIGAIRSRYASVGVSMTGSASDVMVDAIGEQALQKSIIVYESNLKKIELTDDIHRELMAADYAKKAGKLEAEGYRIQGKAYKQAAQTSATASILGGLSGMFNSFGSMMS